MPRAKAAVFESWAPSSALRILRAMAKSFSKSTTATDAALAYLRDLEARRADGKGTDPHLQLHRRPHGAGEAIPPRNRTRLRSQPRARAHQLVPASHARQPLRSRTGHDRPGSELRRPGSLVRAAGPGRRGDQARLPLQRLAIRFRSPVGRCTAVGLQQVQRWARDAYGQSGWPPPEPPPQTRRPSLPRSLQCQLNSQTS